LNFPAMDLEVLRNDVVQKIDAQRTKAQAAVEAIRFVLSDRMPGHGVTLAVKTGMMMIPRRYRDEGLAHIGHGAKGTLARRYTQLARAERHRALGSAWAAALYEDPSVGRRALLRARHDRFALDLGEDGGKSRQAVDEWANEVLAPAALPMGAD